MDLQLSVYISTSGDQLIIRSQKDIKLLLISSGNTNRHNLTGYQLKLVTMCVERTYHFEFPPDLSQAYTMRILKAEEDLHTM